MAFSNVALEGYMASDVELKGSDTKFCAFAVGVAYQVKDKKETSFIDCKAFGKTAEFVAKYFPKGKAVALTGELRQERWEKDGQKRSKVVVICNRVFFTCSNKDERSEERQVPAEVFMPMDGPVVVRESESEIPF